MFHRWLSTDEPHEDHCFACGVTSINSGEGVVADYSPLPIICPGPEVGKSHHFGRLGVELRCHACGYHISPTTLPATVDWECAP
jgi:hypothetical protein